VISGAINPRLITNQDVTPTSAPGPMMSVRMVFKWTNLLIAECCPHELERITRLISSPYAPLVR